jgi:hypothetical protein
MLNTDDTDDGFRRRTTRETSNAASWTQVFPSQTHLQPPPSGQAFDVTTTMSRLENLYIGSMPPPRQPPSHTTRYASHVPGPRVQGYDAVRDSMSSVTNLRSQSSTSGPEHSRSDLNRRRGISGSSPSEPPVSQSGRRTCWEEGHMDPPKPPSSSGAAAHRAHPPSGRGIGQAFAAPTPGFDHSLYVQPPHLSAHVSIDRTSDHLTRSQYNQSGLVAVTRGIQPDPQTQHGPRRIQPRPLHMPHPASLIPPEPQNPSAPSSGPESRPFSRSQSKDTHKRRLNYDRMRRQRVRAERMSSLNYRKGTPTPPEWAGDVPKRDLSAFIDHGNWKWAGNVLYPSESAVVTTGFEEEEEEEEKEEEQDEEQEDRCRTKESGREFRSEYRDDSPGAAGAEISYLHG